MAKAVKVAMGESVLKLVRTQKFDKGARGVFYLPDGASVHTIENHPIPVGSYFLRPDHTGRYNHWVIESEFGSRTAAGRSDVEVHEGNRLSESAACILPGLESRDYGVYNSQGAISKMWSALERTGPDPKTWFLEITEAY